MATIHHRVSIDAPVAKVYEAIATADGIGTWWDRQTPTHTGQGLVLEHHPGPEHGVVKLRVVEQIPNTRVEWECVSTHPSSSPASAWTGTRFVFELADGGERGEPASDTGAGARAVTVDFRQLGYDERSPFFESNKVAWGQVLQNLKRVLESSAARR
jgi:uncharacterized protein YndB with AHSA1/START domain